MYTYSCGDAALSCVTRELDEHGSIEHEIIDDGCGTPDDCTIVRTEIRGNTTTLIRDYGCDGQPDYCDVSVHE